MDTYLGGDAADDELADAVLLDQVRKLGIVEGALAGLVDHRLAGNGISFGYDVVSRLADHEDAAHRAEIADRPGAASAEIGRASGWDRVCQYVSISVVLASLQHNH